MHAEPVSLPESVSLHALFISRMHYQPCYMHVIGNREIRENRDLSGLLSIAEFDSCARMCLTRRWEEAGGYGRRLRKRVTTAPAFARICQKVGDGVSTLAAAVNVVVLLIWCCRWGHLGAELAIEDSNTCCVDTYGSRSYSEVLLRKSDAVWTACQYCFSLGEIRSVVFYLMFSETVCTIRIIHAHTHAIVHFIAVHRGKPHACIDLYTSCRHLGIVRLQSQIYDHDIFLPTG